MADKTVSIAVNDYPDLKMTFKHVTKFEPSEELDSDTTDTFDGPVGRGTENPSYKIDISKLDLESTDETGLSAMERYDLLKDILKALRNHKGTITSSVCPSYNSHFRANSISPRVFCTYILS